MWNYTLADYRRIALHIPRLIFVGLYQAILIAIVIVKWSKNQDSYTSIMFLDSLPVMLVNLSSVFLGLVNMVAAFSFDFKCKTMQVAIGMGVSRLKVVISKFVQVAMLVLTDLLLMHFIVFVLGIITGISLVPQQLVKIVVDMMYVWISTSVYVGLASILIFQVHSLVGPMLLFFMLAFKGFHGLIKMLTTYGPEIFGRLHLESYTFTAFVETFRSHILLGRFNFGAFIGMFVYIGVLIGGCYLVFRKQELDF